MNSSLHLLWRERCRLVFDLLWRGDDPLMTRQAAYAWLSNTLGTPEPRLSTLDLRARHAGREGHASDPPPRERPDR